MKTKFNCNTDRGRASSVFTVGEVGNYLQFGQNFYRINETDFILDKYLTNLLNDYFGNEFLNK